MIDLKNNEKVEKDGAFEEIETLKELTVRIYNQKQSEVKINLMGIPFKFDASDGQALLEIMERYKE